MQRPREKIALLHHVGCGNLGDDATLDTVIQEIKRRRPNAVIAAFTANPEDTEHRHQLPTYPIRARPWSWYTPSASDLTPEESSGMQPREYGLLSYLARFVSSLVFRIPKAIQSELSFLVTSRRIIGAFQVLIISGGGQLTEWGGPWSFLYTLFKWVLMAKSARVKCVFLNVGAGPLTHPISKFFARRALAAADYVSFRDDQSKNLVFQIGFNGGGQVFPDCVYSREVPTPNKNGAETSGQLVVGIAPMPYCDPRIDPSERNLAVYEAFIDRLATFAASLIRGSYLVTMFGTDIGVDPLTIKDLRRNLRTHHNVETPEYQSVSSLDELLSRISAVDYVVTCRFHGVVFAHLLNKPVLALSHHPKMVSLMNELGLSNYCLDIRTFEPAVLADRFASLVADTDEIKHRMANRLAKYKKRLARQFDELFAG
jgi:polysaccharide pyruvyl transferase WcaK-like protein